MYIKELDRLRAKLDAILAGLEGRTPVFPPRARPFNPELSAKLDTLLVLEEDAETLSERELWRNLRERESTKIYSKFEYVGGNDGYKRVSGAF